MTEQEFERIYNVPLRKGSAMAARYRRAAKASRVLREFLERHTKSTDVKIGKYLNHKLLENGRKNIPHHVLVKVVKNKEGVVKAELVGAPEEIVEKTPIKETKTKETLKSVPEKLDVESVKREKEEIEKKKVLEHPKTEKHKENKENKEVSSEIDEEMRKKGMVKRKDKKEIISK